MRAELYPYQKKLTSQIISEYNNDRTNVVLAAACGGGKTIMAISICEELVQINPDIRILVLTHGQTILRDNFEQKVRKQCPNFSSVVVNEASKLDLPAQVYIGLPQTIKGCSNLKFDVVIVDEAHQFYWAEDGMVQRIIEQSAPKFTLFLTGSPSKFIKHNYTLYSISLVELYELGFVCSPVIELAKTSYDYTFKDYSSKDELLGSVHLSREATEHTLDDLLSKIESVLGSLTRTKPEVRNKLSMVWKWALGSLGKSMFVCRSQTQASHVRGYFERNGINVALSTSSYDPNTEEIDRFVRDDECLVLIVVNRGVLGFDFPRLVNVVDMSGSMNADVLFQMLCRLVRKHPEGKEKLFFKVVPDSLAEYTQVLMSFVVALSHKRFYDTYTGEYRKTEVPITKEFRETLDRPRLKREISETGSRRSIADLPPLPRLDMMNSLWHKDGELLSSYAYTTLEATKKKFEGGSLGELFPELLKEWDYSKNSADPFTTSYGSETQVWWKCRKGHEWQTMVWIRTVKGSGCLQCFRGCKDGNNLAAKFPEIAAEWSIKNVPLRPEDISPMSNKRKVWWVCSEGHDWETTVKSRVVWGTSCPKCASISSTFPEIAAEWDYAKNEWHPDDVLPKSRKNVWWRCKEGHSWQEEVINRTRKQGKPGKRKYTRIKRGCPVCFANRPKEKTHRGHPHSKTVTHVVRQSIVKGVIDYGTLLDAAIEGVKQGTLSRTSGIIIHNIVKDNLMKLYYEPLGFKTWRQVCSTLPNPPKWEATVKKLQEAGIEESGKKEVQKSGRKRGRPRKNPLPSVNETFGYPVGHESPDNECTL